MSDEQKLKLAREALDEVMQRFDLLAVGDNVVERLCSTAKVVAVTANYIEAREASDD